MSDDRPRWPHQLYAVNECDRLIAEGIRRIVVQSPTGGGKSLMMSDLAQRVLERGGGVALFTNRKILTEQVTKNLANSGLDHGVRAAGHQFKEYEAFQVCSIQTEYSRVVKRKVRVAHRCDLVIVDEAHLMENPTASKVYEAYLAGGAAKVGFTATPLGLDGCYDYLVQSGTNSELRECGALVPATHFGCTEPDLRNIKRVPIGDDLPDELNAKLIMVPGIHGRVIDWYRRLNPHGLPAIGFAPGVPESVGFAEAFERAGIPAAHIDGDRIWVRGEEYPSTQERRDELLAMSRTGQVRVVWNRFVLREAVDMPWLRHGILATVFGSLQSYLQSGGRLLRACPPAGKRDVTVQDHGGNYWRHGSLNSDRVWRIGDTNRTLAADRLEDFTGENDTPPREVEPFRCPGCGCILQLGSAMRGDRATCGQCGYQFDFRRRSRPVLQTNGELVEHPGLVFRPRRVDRRNDTEEKWRAMYYRAKNSKTMTFTQAAGLFYHENGYYPPRSLPLMPVNARDWYRVVATIPRADLNQKET